MLSLFIILGAMAVFAAFFIGRETTVRSDEVLDSRYADIPAPRAAHRRYTGTRRDNRRAAR